MSVGDLIEHSRTGEALPGQIQVIIKSQVAYMSRLVEELINAARIGGCVFPLERSTFDIAQAISSAVQACRPTMEAKLQHFEMRLPLSEVRFVRAANGYVASTQRSIGSYTRNRSPHGGGAWRHARRQKCGE
jgi:signal transduction histidine kinase